MQIKGEVIFISFFLQYAEFFFRLLWLLIAGLFIAMGVYYAIKAMRYK
jgi:hypothetical protein